MKVLITGAAGFLGRWFMEHHLAAGDKVLGVDDMSAKHALWADGHMIQEDAGVYFARGADTYFDRAYHFAAPVGGRLKIEGDPLFNADALRLDAAFFRWAIGCAKMAVYPSSSAVYGTQLQRRGTNQQLHEGMFHPSQPTWMAPDELYGLTKLVGETLAWKASQYGLTTLCIRPFSGYGEGQPEDYPITAICRRAIAREDPLIVWGSGQQKRDFVHASDIVGAVDARLKGIAVGYNTMNIGTGRGTNFIDIAKAAAKIVGYEPEIVTDPTKPEGVGNRRSDTARSAFYYEPKVVLWDGLTRVINWLEATS